VLDLVVDDEGDDLADEERRAREAQIARGWESVREGRGRDGQDVIDSLRRDR
jgi:hypothetical protein